MATLELFAYALSGALVGMLLSRCGREIGSREDDLSRVSLLDELTGLFNRRYFNIRLEQEFERAQRYGLPLTVAMLDLDELKRINDHLGHAAGDSALVEVAKQLAVHVRSSDVPARIGGDEFALLLPHTRVDEAEALAQRIRSALSLTQPRSSRSVTISVGLAGTSRGEAHTAATLLEHADRALLRAKGHGRNRVASYERRPPLRGVTPHLSGVRIGSLTGAAEAQADAG
jgi:diguanylate cyclase (GGDEF)-like protein